MNAIYGVAQSGWTDAHFMGSAIILFLFLGFRKASTLGKLRAVRIRGLVDCASLKQACSQTKNLLQVAKTEGDRTFVVVCSSRFSTV